MASYTNWDEFKEAVKDITGMARGDFLNKVKHAHIEDPGQLPDTAMCRALVFAQAHGLAPPEYTCPACGADFTLSFANREDCDGGRLQWRGPRSSDDGCDKCSPDKRVIVSKLTFLDNTITSRWMDKLDRLCMWLADYARRTILLELNHLDHKSVDKWLTSFRETVSEWYDLVAPVDVKKLFKKDTAVAT